MARGSNACVVNGPEVLVASVPDHSSGMAKDGKCEAPFSLPD